MNINIAADGSLRFIYNDELVELLEQGEARIARASHVEPYAGVGGGWMANMQPSLPPGLTPPMSEWMLGPFKTRGEALAAEVAWLERERGL